MASIVHGSVWNGQEYVFGYYTNPNNWFTAEGLVKDGASIPDLGSTGFDIIVPTVSADRKTEVYLPKPYWYGAEEDADDSPGYTGFKTSPHLWSKQARIIDVDTRTVRHNLSHDTGVLSVALSADGKTVISGSIDGTVTIWNAHTGTVRHTLSAAHIDGVNSVAISADGSKFVSVGDHLLDEELDSDIPGPHNGEIKIWSSESGELLSTIRSNTETIRRYAPRLLRRISTLAMSSDGNMVVSGSQDDGAVRVWELPIVGLTKISKRVLNKLGVAQGTPIPDEIINRIEYMARKKWTGDDLITDKEDSKRQERRDYFKELPRGV